MVKKGNKNNKKLIFGALSAVAASVATGVFVKKAMQKKEDVTPENSESKKNTKKRNKNLYYTVNLNDIYDPYNDQTMSEEDMINEIKKETSL